MKTQKIIGTKWVSTIQLKKGTIIIHGKNNVGSYVQTQWGPRKVITCTTEPIIELLSDCPPHC